MEVGDNLEEKPFVIEVPHFTREDFLDTSKPYEWLYQFKGDEFTLKRLMFKVMENAKAVKVTGFKSMYKEYEKSLKQIAGGTILDGNVTQFEGQELELSCGAWVADEMGISIMTPLGEQFACPHPIMPVLRLVNIDSGEEKMKIAYRKGKQWRSSIVDKRTLASANSIVALANNGVAVTSENARYLVKYMSDVENINYDLIPEKASVGRLGWVSGGFSPYVDGLVFDGEEYFKKYFDSVKTHGDRQKWLDFAQKVRKGKNIPARLILAAAFASALVKPLHCLSFFVHLWGSESGIGKTVGLMFAASVWANPEKGQYWNTFNATGVGQELSAGFLNSLPLILDEFQMLKNKKDFEGLVYMLAEGVGKVRGSKQGGIQRTQTWYNCILTSGEMPITNFMTGAGAFNRIVEIECEEPLFENMQEVLSVSRENYGFAGKEFVGFLQEDGNIEEAQAVYQIYFNEIIQSDATEKQAMAGALLLTADRLIDDWIFKDGAHLTFAEIGPYLQTKQEVDVGERAYNYLCEVIAVNINRFRDKDNPGEVWGIMEPDEGRVYINRNVFGRLCEEGGFSDKATLSWLIRNKLIETSVDKRRKKPQPTVQKKICGNNTKCVLLYLNSTNNEEMEKIDEILL